MRGRTLEEIDELFQNEIPTKEFPKYRCVSSERARELALKHTGVEEAVVGTVEEGEKMGEAGIQQKEISG